MRLPLVLLVCVLLAPAACAHVAFERPSLQDTQPLRSVTVATQGAGAAFTLLQSSDPLRHGVEHRVDPRGSLHVEHRPDLALGPSLSLRTELERLAEYRDLNADGRYTPDLDSIARSWRFGSQPWVGSVVQNVTVGGARGKSVTWNADLSGNPHFELTAAAAGQQVLDEGALARPQDVLLYLDVSSLPARGTGHLHVLEGRFVAPLGAVLHEVRGADNATAGVYVERGGERAYLLWGAQATVDGREQLLAFTRGEATEDAEAGEVSWPFRLHFPTADRGMRIVAVQAAEYEATQARSPSPGPALLVAALAGLALLVRRRR